MQYRDLELNKLLLENPQVVEEKLTITSSGFEYLFRSTVFQSQLSLWFEHTQKSLHDCLKVWCYLGNSCQQSFKITVTIDTSRIFFAKHQQCEGDRAEEIARDTVYVNKPKRSTNVSNRVCWTEYQSFIPSSWYSASPDSLISCICFGLGLLEIKCPFSIKLNIPHRRPPYLERKDENRFKLSTEHNHHLQVQGQIAILERTYCDFVYWTPVGLHVESIYYDQQTYVSVMIFNQTLNQRGNGFVPIVRRGNIYLDILAFYPYFIPQFNITQFVILCIVILSLWQYTCIQ